MLSLLFVGCKPPDPVPDTPVDRDAAVSLLGDLGANLLLPAEIGVDPVSGRGWVASITSPPVRVVAFDLGTGALTTVEAPAESAAALKNTHFGVVPGGATWVTATGTPAIQRIAAGTNVMEAFETSLEHAVAAVPMADGRVALVGTDGESGLVAVYEEDGAVVGEVALSDAPVAAAWDEANGQLGVLVEGSEIVLVDGDSLEPAGTCAAGYAAEQIAALGDGRWMLTSMTRVYIAACDGEDVPGLAVGSQNGPPVPYDTDRFFVPDCIGVAEVAGERWSVARVVAPDLSLVGDAFPTGRHTCSAARDPTTGYVWMPDETSTTVLAVDPATGETMATWQVGVHIEALAAVPGDPDAVVMTGRLSDSLGRVDLATGSALRTDREVAWPGSPTWVGDDLWVLGQIDMQLYQVDPETLAPIRTVATGLPENAGMVLGALAWDGERFWVSDGATNRLVAVDPAVGIVGTWDLPGDPPDNRTVVGRVEVLVGDGAVFTVNTFNGWLGRVEFGKPEVVASVEGSLARWSGDDGEVNLHWGWWDPERDLLFAGSAAYDGADLGRREDADARADFLVGRRSDGALLGWREAVARLVAMDGDETVGSWALAPEWQAPAILKVEGDRVVYADVDGAAIGKVDVGPR